MSEEFVKTTDHGGFIVNEYRGSYSLNSAWQADDGVVRQNWALRQKGRDQYADKATPVKIDLGPTEDAKKALLEALRIITGVEYDLAVKKKSTPIEDVPF